MMLIGGTKAKGPRECWNAERIDCDMLPLPPGLDLPAVIVIPATLRERELIRVLAAAEPGDMIGVRRAGLPQHDFKIRSERIAAFAADSGRPVGQVHELDDRHDISAEITSNVGWHGLDGSRPRDAWTAPDVFGRAAHTIMACCVAPRVIISGTGDTIDPDAWLTEVATYALIAGIDGVLWNGQGIPGDDAWENAARIAAYPG